MLSVSMVHRLSTTYKFVKCLQKRDLALFLELQIRVILQTAIILFVREEIDAFSKLKFESQFRHFLPVEPSAV